MGLSCVEKVVWAIADVEDTDPEDLEMSLQNWVEVDAIRQLAEHDSSSWELQFEVPNHNVTVDGDGAVHVDGVRQRTTTSD